MLITVQNGGIQKHLGPTGTGSQRKRTSRTVA